MQVDKTTVNDLSIFNADETLSVFRKLDFTTTIGGKDWLRALLVKPYGNLKQIEEMQQMLQSLLPLLDSFPTTISNGTIMVIERFYETPLDEMPAHANTVNSISYKVFHSADFSLARYSVEHFINFFKGLNSIVQLCSNVNSVILKNISTRIASLIAKPVIREMIDWDKTNKLPYRLILHFGNYMRRQYKQEALELVNTYSKLDAYCSMATACRHYHFCIPTFEESSQPFMQAVQLYHPLLSTPVAYDIQLSPQQNFLFMTGANMAGKSTFIKAIGVAVYLAHVGMGVMH